MEALQCKALGPREVTVESQGSDPGPAHLCPRGSFVCLVHGMLQSTGPGPRLWVAADPSSAWAFSH